MERCEQTRSDRFAELHREVCGALQERNAQRMERATSGAEETRQIEKAITGCAEALGDPSLDRATRARLETDLAAAVTRRHEIEKTTAADAVTETQLLNVSLKDVEERVRRLHEVLGGCDPSQINLELSQHIDNIRCYPDGRVVVRTSRLGGLTDLRELLTRKSDDRNESHQSADGEDPGRVKSRRRPRRRVHGEDGQMEALQAADLWAVDPCRFAEVDEQWFRRDEFRVPPTMSWAKRHAREVAEYRLTHRVSFNELARHFGRRRGTIRKAIRIAQSEGLDASESVWKHPRKPNWALKNAAAVARFLNEPGATVAAAARHFGKCVKTIRKARALADRT